MRWLFSLLIAVSLTATPTFPGKISFIRDGDLWIYQAGQERKLTTSGKTALPRFSPDGRYLIYVENQQYYVTDPHSGNRWPLPDVSGTTLRVTWSPTANELAYTTADGVVITPVTATGPGKPRRIAPKGWSAPAWAPDGKRLALLQPKPGPRVGTGDTTIATVPHTGGEPFVVSRIEHSMSADDCGIGGISSLTWSADGQWIAMYLTGYTSSIAADCNHIAVAPADGKGPEDPDQGANGVAWPRILGTSPAVDGWLKWSPVGSTLAYVDGLGRDAAHNKQLRITVTPIPGPGRPMTPKDHADRDPAWAPDGVRLALSRSAAPLARMDEPAPDQAIWIFDTKTGQDHKVPGSAGGATPAWTRDGALFWIKPFHERGDLYYLPSGASEPTKLIQNIGPLSSYYGQWNTQAMLDWWVPGR